MLALHGLASIFEQVGEPATVQFEKAGGLDHLEKLQMWRLTEIGKMAQELLIRFFEIEQVNNQNSKLIVI